jgi:hypothetical protein
MSLRVVFTGEVKPLSGGAGAKASLNRANQSVEADAKLCDLSLVRLKMG